MENKGKDLEKKMEAEKDDPTTGFANSAKASAAVVNHGGDKKAKNYKNSNDKAHGPNWDKLSDNSDGDTSQNAGVFK